MSLNTTCQVMIQHNLPVGFRNRPSNRPPITFVWITKECEYLRSSGCPESHEFGAYFVDAQSASQRRYLGRPSYPNT